VKDPEEFSSSQLLELFQPAPFAAFVLKFPGEHESGPAKNKVGNCGMFFGDEIRGVFSPPKPRIPPQFHQRITIKKTPVFPNPLQKRP
jgi:hypothetical protein